MLNRLKNIFGGTPRRRLISTIVTGLLILGGVTPQVAHIGGETAGRVYEDIESRGQGEE